MKKSKLTKLLILSLSALCVFSSCGNKNSSSEPSSSSSSSVEEQKPGWGTEESPLSPDELYEKMKNMGNDEWTTEKGYLKGVVKTSTYDSSYKTYEIELVTSGSHVVKIFGASLKEGVSSPEAGDTVTGFGFFQRYHASKTGEVAYELAYKSDTKDRPEIIKVVKGEGSTLEVEYEGSKEEPLTIEAVNEKIEALEENTSSKVAAYVKGIVASVTENGEKYNIELTDGENSLTVFGSVLEEGVNLPVAGDEIIASGYYKNYYGLYELAFFNKVTPTVVASSHKDYEISAKIVNFDGEEDASLATVTVASTSTSGKTETIEITPIEGHKISRVSVNGKVLKATNGSYSFVTSHANNIVIKVVSNDAPVAEEHIAKYTAGETSNLNGSDQAELLGLDDDLFSVVGNKGSASNNIGINKDGSIRIYKGNKSGHNLTISVSEEHTIETLTLTFTSKTYSEGCTVTVDGVVIEPSDGVYYIDASEFQISNTNLDEQIRIKQISMFVL